MNDSVTAKMVRDGRFQDTRITRACLICETYEDPQADVANLSVPWLCDRCKRKLRAVVEKEESE